MIQDPVIDILLRGSKLNGAASLPLWDGIRVERRFAAPGARDEDSLDAHYIILWGGEPTIAEREYKSGRFDRVVKRPGTLSLGSPGRLPAVRPITSYDVVACIIDDKALRRVSDEMGRSSMGSIHDHLGIADPPLVHLMRLLAMETEAGGAGGNLYRDSLSCALASRYLTVASTDFQKAEKVHALSKPQLKRVLDKIHGEYEKDIGLSELAEISGYSRAHFLKMFRTATGKTPGEYLRDMRLEQARKALVEGKESLAAIAAAVGFSSHSHLTRLFIKRFKMPPSLYRRSSAGAELSFDDDYTASLLKGRA